jgi:hypothetical protein
LSKLIYIAGLYDLNNKEVRRTEYNRTEEIVPIGFSLNAGMGLEFELTNKLGIYSLINYNHMLTTIVPNSISLDKLSADFLIFGFFTNVFFIILILAFYNIIKHHGIEWFDKIKLSVSSLYDLSPKEEDNIKYVATTRSADTLYYVTDMAKKKKRVTVK